MEYTDEQLRAAQAFRERKPLKVKAFAGTGKTTLLRLMAERDNRRGLYLAYNNEIARESRKKFPNNVTCLTAHALALKCLPKELEHKKNPVDSLNPAQLVGFLNRQVALSTIEVGRLAQQVESSMHWFCVSDHEYPSIVHVQRAIADSGVVVDPDIVHSVMPAVWDAMTCANGALPLTFDAQLKLLQLSEKSLPFDYALADEVQDMYPAIRSVICNADAQVAWVGDPNQQIYDFNGAENAMDQLNELDQYSLTLAFRFGEWLAELVQPLLSQLGEKEKIRGNPEVETRRATRTQPVRLARSNSSLLPPLVKAVTSGKAVHVLGGTSKLDYLLNSAERVMRRQPVSDGLFAGLDSWTDARAKASERGNGKLRSIVELLEKYRLSGVRRCVDSACAKEGNAEVVLSTVHQAKGREFPKVGIIDDFRGKLDYLMTFQGKALYAPPSDMVRLLYVALTRAEKELFVPMSLARQYGITAELRETQRRAQSGIGDQLEGLPEVDQAEPEAFAVDRSCDYDSWAAPQALCVPDVQSQRSEEPVSSWDRWGLRLVVVAGILANLAMLDYKGYIDLSSVGVLLGK